MAYRHTLLLPVVIFTSILLASCESSDGGATVPAGLSTSSDQLSIPVPLGRLAPSEIPDDIEPDLELNVSYSDSQANSLTKKQIALLPSSVSVDDIYVAYEAVLAANPDLPVTSNDFALLIIEELRATEVQERGSVDNDGALIPHLILPTNDMEKELLLNNPQFIDSTRNTIVRATIAAGLRAAGTSIVDTVVELELQFGSPWKDRADAFRHAYWTWLLSDCCGVDWAEAFSNAHESNQPNNDDTRMDLNNNAAGILVYSRNSAATPEQARTTIMEMDIKYINETMENVTITRDSLVYLLPVQALVLFDDGPAFDDIYGFSFDGVMSANTPVGGAVTYAFRSIKPGSHPMVISCVEDSTEAGCGFSYSISGAMFNGMGGRNAGQIIIQEGEAYSDDLTFPRLIDLFTELN